MKSSTGIVISCIKPSPSSWAEWVEITMIDGKNVEHTVSVLVGGVG